MFHPFKSSIPRPGLGSEILDGPKHIWEFPHIRSGNSLDDINLLDGAKTNLVVLPPVDSSLLSGIAEIARSKGFYFSEYFDRISPPDIRSKLDPLLLREGIQAVELRDKLLALIESIAVTLNKYLKSRTISIRLETPPKMSSVADLTEGFHADILGKCAGGNEPVRAICTLFGPGTEILPNIFVKQEVFPGSSQSRIRTPFSALTFPTGSILLMQGESHAFAGNPIWHRAPRTDQDRLTLVIN